MTFGITLRRCLMYLAHFWMLTLSRNVVIPLTSSSFVVGFISWRRNYFRSWHKFSMGFRSGLSGRVSHQFTPSDSKNWVGCWGVFGIIILHQAVSIRIDFMQEWQESLAQDGNIGLGIHDSIKVADPSSSTHANACPDMDLHCVLWHVQTRGLISSGVAID